MLRALREGVGMVIRGLRRPRVEAETDGEEAGYPAKIGGFSKTDTGRMLTPNSPRLIVQLLRW